jgi:Flp pilus assembly protein TadG
MPPRRSEFGAVAVEFALIVPLLIGLLLAVATGGIAFSRSISLNDAVRAGGRVGATMVSSPGWGDAVKIYAESLMKPEQGPAPEVCVQLTKGLVEVRSSTGCTLGPAPITPVAITDCVVKVWAERRVQFIARIVYSEITLKRSTLLRYELPPAPGQTC